MPKKKVVESDPESDQDQDQDQDQDPSESEDNEEETGSDHEQDHEQDHVSDSESDQVDRTDIPDKDKYLMYLSTVQGTVLKTLTETLNSVLTDLNIKFDENGISVITIDAKRVLLVSVVMQENYFEKYYCPNKQILGVSMLTLHKLFKTIGNNDVVSLYLLKSSPNELGIRIQNKKKRIDNNIFYRLIDVNEVNIEIPELDYDAEIIMPCSDFQKYCRELSNIANYVTVYTTKGKIFSLEADGSYAKQVLNIEQLDGDTVSIDIKNESCKIGTFSLKILSSICKSTTLCSTIQLYMKRKLPIILVYSIGTLGICKFCLCPENDDADEDEYED